MQVNKRIHFQRVLLEFKKNTSNIKICVSNFLFERKNPSTFISVRQCINLILLRRVVHFADERLLVGVNMITLTSSQSAIYVESFDSMV